MADNPCCQEIQWLAKQIEDEQNASGHYEEAALKFEGQGLLPDILEEMAQDERRHSVLLRGLVELGDELCGCRQTNHDGHV